jgi:hypothetical protein
MKNLARWCVVHAIHWALLYGAFVAGIDGAMYVLKFFVWCMWPLSFLLASKDVIAKDAKEPPKPFLSALSAFQAWVTLFFLVWHGHFFTGLAWLIVIVMIAHHRAETKKVREALAKEPPHAL